MEQADRSAVARPIPVLRYLAVDAYPTAPDYSIDAALFGDHLDALHDQGYIALSVSNLLTAISIDAPLPSKAVVITFDQGLRGFYEYALPALRRRDMPASVFVTTGFVGRESRALPGSSLSERSTMTWTHLRDLVDDDIEIGSNGHSYRPLDVMSRWEAGEELALSRSLLEHQLQRPISVAAYPSGLASAATRAAAARVGYQAACTLRGTVSSNYDDPFAIARIPVDGTMRPEILLAHLAILAKRRPATREPLREKLARTVRRVGTIGSTEASLARTEAARTKRTGGSHRTLE